MMEIVKPIAVTIFALIFGVEMKRLMGRISHWAFVGLVIFAVVILLRLVFRYWGRIW